jgi:hypothetical protein
MDPTHQSVREEVDIESGGSGGMLESSPLGCRVHTVDPRRVTMIHVNDAEDTTDRLSAADAQARKRLQASNFSDADLPTHMTGSGVVAMDPKPPMHARRRSTLRENKAPLLGPRPLELMQTKRYLASFVPRLLGTVSLTRPIVLG